MKLKRAKIIKSSLSRRIYRVRKDCDFVQTLNQCKTDGGFWIHWAMENGIIEEIKPDYIFIGDKLINHED